MPRATWPTWSSGSAAALRRSRSAGRRAPANRNGGSSAHEGGSDGRSGMKALGTDIGTIHFVGIGGIGMSGIAEVMHQLGL